MGSRVGRHVERIPLAVDWSDAEKPAKYWMHRLMTIHALLAFSLQISRVFVVQVVVVSSTVLG